FYMRPFISLRGAPLMRYQGDEMAQIETELRWQCWKRFSIVGFVGTGVAWNDFERIVHHLKANLWKPDTHVLIVGYQGDGSLGRQLVEGRKVVSIHGEKIAVKAQVHTL